MNQKKTSLAAILLVSLISVSSVIPAYADRPPVTTQIRFGDPANSCSGKGICNQTDASAISVTFTYVDHNTIIMSFALNDLEDKQYDQVQYFQGSSYMFDTHYNLNTSTFAGWNLNQGAWINTTSSSSLSVVNGIVYDTIGLEYYY